MRYAGDPGRRLEKECRLANPGLPADEDERATDEAAAEDPVQLGDADGLTRDVGFVDGREGCRLVSLAGSGSGRRRLAAGWLADDRLHEAVPLAAGTALALPAEEGLGARLADEPALRPAADAGHASACRAGPLSWPRPV
jgi:hypothetical protein